ncbi:Caps the barbed end of actin filaments and is able to sever them in a calcium-dependent manner [Orobanche gracilis]
MVWRVSVNGQQRSLLQVSEQSKFYSGDCYVFQYSYPAEEKDEHLIGTWFGKQSVEEDRVVAISQASKLAESLKFAPTQARIHEGNEPLQFFAIFQSFIVFKGGLSEGYKNYIAKMELQDDTYSEDGLALFRVQGSGPENMQAIQVDPVWRVSVNGQQRSLLQVSEQSKFYSGDCYVFQYSYPGEEKDEHLIGTWFGKQSVEEDRVVAISQASKLAESLKFAPTQARIHEGNEPLQFFAIFQSFIVFKGGLSEGYKNYIAKMELQDDTYSEDGLALFRVQGSGPENMQAIQVDPVASSLSSSYCYILHSGSTVFTWSGNLTTSEAQELAERQLDLIKVPQGAIYSLKVEKIMRMAVLEFHLISPPYEGFHSCPNLQSKLQKEGAESEQFWDLLGGKSEYPSHKIARKSESDPHLFSCTLTNGDLKVTEVHNFNQDDLMTEDIFILDCQSDIYVWVGRNLESKTKMNALNIGEKFLKIDFIHEKLSLLTPIYIVMEGGEPTFFTRFFSWDSTRSAMHGNSFQRKLAILKHGGTLPVMDKPKRRSPVSHTGRSAVQDKSQRSRSMSFSPDRVRVRGRSPAFNALAATFENPNARNLSTPPPVVSKIYPKSVTSDSGKLPSKSAAIAALTSTFEQPSPPARKLIIPRSPKEMSPEIPRPKSETVSRQKSEEPKPPKLQEDVNKNEAEDDGLPVYPYDRLKTTSTDPVAEINVSKREGCDRDGIRRKICYFVFEKIVDALTV